MDKPIFDFKDPQLDAGLAAKCALSMIIGTDGVSLLATEKSGEIRALKTHNFSSLGRDFRDAEAQIRSVFGSESLFSYSFNEVCCAFFNLNTTLVPPRLFDPGNLPVYFKLLLQPADYEYRYDELPEFDCFLAYALEPMMARMCGQYFPKGKILHLATPLLKAWGAVASPRDYEVFLNVRNQVAQIAVFDRQNLLYYNALRFNKPSDLLYFALLPYDQFRLNTSDVPLTLSGLLPEDSDAFRLLYRYLQTIRFVQMPEKIVLPESADILPPCYWYDLVSLYNYQLIDRF